MAKSFLPSTHQISLTVAPSTDEALRGAWHAYALNVEASHHNQTHLRAYAVPGTIFAPAGSSPLETNHKRISMPDPVLPENKHNFISMDPEDTAVNSESNKLCIASSDSIVKYS